MQKIVVHRPGGYSCLTFEHHTGPQPGPGEVLIRVRSIGVNYADCIVRMGLYSSAKELSGYPITPGFEVAGEVAALGAGVEDLQSYRHVAPMGRLVVYGFASMLPRGGRRRNWLKLAWHYWRTPCFDPLRMTNSNRSVMAKNPVNPV